MNAVQDHVFAIQLSIKKLAQGKFWLYLVPALVITFIFYTIQSVFNSLFGHTGIFGDSFRWMINTVYGFFILTLLSPVNCMLSEKIDNEITGAKFDGGFVRIMNDIFRSIVIVIISSLLNLVLLGCWALTSWITGLGFLDNFIYFSISSFFYGFAFYDYSHERYEMGIWETFRFGIDRFGYMLITGILFNLIYMISPIGMLFAPFLITIVSTIVFLKMKNKISNSHITQ